MVVPVVLGLWPCSWCCGWRPPSPASSSPCCPRRPSACSPAGWRRRSPAPAWALGWTLLAGIVGSWLGGALFALLGIGVGGLLNPINLVASVVGAAILITLARVLARPALTGSERRAPGRGLLSPGRSCRPAQASGGVFRAPAKGARNL